MAIIKNKDKSSGMTQTYVSEVLEIFMNHGNPVDAMSMAKYMKNKF